MRILKALVGSCALILSSSCAAYASMQADKDTPPLTRTSSALGRKDTKQSPAPPLKSVKTIQFNKAFLHGTAKTIDLSAFTYANYLPPGLYVMKIYVNDTYAGQEKVHFIESALHDKTTPCITTQLLKNIGAEIRKFKLPKNFSKTACLNTQNEKKFVTLNYSAQQQRLNIFIPQIYTDRTWEDRLEKGFFDPGINSFALGYHAIYVLRNDDSAPLSHSLNLALNGHINLWQFHFIHNSMLTYSSDEKLKWQNLSNYVTRNIVPWRSELQIGDSQTPFNIFDSVNFFGVQLQSQDKMLPSSLQGFAPTVEGIASTNAVITIKQNGYTLLKKSVPPGPFKITNIPSVGEGDLDVTIQEADGSTRHYTQAATSSSKLLRPGVWAYNLSFGTYRSGFNNSLFSSQQPVFLQGYVSRGFNRAITPYIGALLSKSYGILGVGFAKSIKHLGAIAIDALYSMSQIKKSTHTLNGLKLHASYNKYFDTKTGLSFSGDFASRDFRSFAQASNTDPNQNAYNNASTVNNLQQLQFQASLSQDISSLFSISASGSYIRYWDQTATQASASFNVGGGWKNISWTASYTFTQGDAGLNHQLLFTLSMPLGFEQTQHTPTVSYSVNYDKESGIVHDLNVSGNLLKGEEISYEAQLGVDQDSHISWNIGGDYRSSFGEFGGNYFQDQSSRQATFSAQGGIVGFKGGLAFAQDISNTMIFVKLGHRISGISLNENTSIKTGWNGVAVMPYAMPYQKNTLTLDVKDFGPYLTSRIISKDIYIEHNAFGLISFNVHYGRKALITFETKKNKKLPIGADIQDASGKSYGVLGNENRAFVSGVHDKEILNVGWQTPTGRHKACSFILHLPRAQAKKFFENITATCQ